MDQRQHISYAKTTAQRLDSTEYYRTVLKQDRREYIFSRIRLLA